MSKKDNKIKTIQIRIDRKLYDKYTKEVIETGTNMSVLCRGILIDHMKKKESEKDV